jgi:hypothetical protein
MYKLDFANPASEVVLMLFLTLFRGAPIRARVTLTLPYAESVTRIVHLEEDSPTSDRGYFNFTIPTPPENADGTIEVRIYPV